MGGRISRDTSQSLGSIKEAPGRAQQLQPGLFGSAHWACHILARHRVPAGQESEESVDTCLPFSSTQHQPSRRKSHPVPPHLPTCSSIFKGSRTQNPGRQGLVTPRLPTKAEHLLDLASGITKDLGWPRGTGRFRCSVNPFPACLTAPGKWQSHHALFLLPGLSFQQVIQGQSDCAWRHPHAVCTNEEVEIPRDTWRLSAGSAGTIRF